MLISKRIGFMVMVLVLVMAFFGWGCAPEEEPVKEPENGEPVEEPEETHTLHFATFWPDVDIMVQEGHHVWAEELEERTEGRVEVEFHYGGALLGPAEIYEGVADGAADIGSTCPSYTPGVFPVVESFELPGYDNQSALAASKAVNEGVEELMEDGHIDGFEDVKPLFFWATGPGHLLTIDPIEDLGDLQGTELRTTGGATDTIESLGGVPVSAPMSEAYMSIETGVMEGIISPYDVMRGFELAELVDYATETDFLYNIVFMKVMNKDTFNALPEDVQETIEEMNEEYVKEYGQVFDDSVMAGYEYGVDEHGVEIIELDEEEKERWEEEVKPVVQNHIEEMDGMGLPGEEIVETIEDKFSDYSAEYGEDYLEELR